MGKLACEEAVKVTGYMLLWCSVWNYSIIVVMEKKTFKCVGQSWGMFPMGETVRQWKWNSHSGSGLLRGLFGNLGNRIWIHSKYLTDWGEQIKTIEYDPHSLDWSQVLLLAINLPTCPQINFHSVFYMVDELGIILNNIIFIIIIKNLIKFIMYNNLHYKRVSIAYMAQSNNKNWNRCSIRI